jgi:hypothetical protein
VLAVGQLEESLEQVDAGHALGQTAAQQPARPHHRLTVGEQQIGLEQGLAQQRVATKVHHLGRIDDPDEEPGIRCDGLLAAVQDLLEGQRVELEAEERSARGWAVSAGVWSRLDGAHAGSRDVSSKFA